ncbi:cysteine-rich CWC family protein [Spirosoma aerophilum]
MKPLLSNKQEHTSCPRCQRTFDCRAEEVSQCQCQAVALTEPQQNYIRSLYEGCLCATCLLALQTDYQSAMVQCQNR